MFLRDRRKCEKLAFLVKKINFKKDTPCSTIDKAGSSSRCEYPVLFWKAYSSEVLKVDIYSFISPGFVFSICVPLGLNS